MKKALEILNQLESEGILKRYAIGGAMGAMFYIEPVLTFDLDVFVLLPEQGPLLSLSTIYEALLKKGFKAVKETIDIDGTPVQFLPVYNELLEEALECAVDVKYQEIPIRVLRAEHLIAICVQTGRRKDRERVGLFLDESKYDAAYLKAVLDRHNLAARWREWTGR
jgi:hypothetical protein